MNIENDMGKKNNNPVVMVIIVILILAIIAIIVFKRINPETETLDQSETELNQALETDSTTSINSNLNSINMEDTSEADLQEVDQELGNL